MIAIESTCPIFSPYKRCHYDFDPVPDFSFLLCKRVQYISIPESDLGTVELMASNSASPADQMCDLAVPTEQDQLDDSTEEPAEEEENRPPEHVRMMERFMMKLLLCSDEVAKRMMFHDIVSLRIARGERPDFQMN